MAMKTIQVVVDEPTLSAADRAARLRKMNRSELVREALRQYLSTQAVRDAEALDRAGYAEHPQSSDDPAAWDGLQSWPED